MKFNDRVLLGSGEYAIVQHISDEYIMVITENQESKVIFRDDIKYVVNKCDFCDIGCDEEHCHTKEK